jgi:TP901 family phage tail tape measure protein
LGDSTYDIISKLTGIDDLPNALKKLESAQGANKDAAARLREEYEKLNSAISRQRTTMSVGQAGLELFVKGVKAAGDYESSLTELRLSIQRLGKDGSLDVATLNSQMEDLVKLGDRLGATIPGTTKDFIDMFGALRQAGVDVPVILGGAGEAVANLAAVSKEAPADLGKAFGQIGTKFELKPEDYAKSADLLARLSHVTNQKPGQLIEGLKGFGSAAGLKGIAGLTTGAELLAAFRRFGADDKIGAAELSEMFSRLKLNRDGQRKSLAQLRKQGIDLQFFDKQGNFKGIESLIEQMAKLNKLKPDAREKVSKDLFGDKGKEAAAALSGIGVAHFRDLTDEARRIPSLAEQARERTKDLNEAWEKVVETTQKAAAKGFLPVAHALTPILRLTSQIIGGLGEWVGKHEAIAGVAAGFLGLGSAITVVVGGFHAARTAIGLYRLAANLARNESLVLGKAASTAAGEIETSASRASSTMSGLGKLSGTRLATGLVTGIGLGLATYGIEKAISAHLNSEELEKNAGAAGYKLQLLREQGTEGLDLAGKTREQQKETIETAGERRGETAGALAAEALNLRSTDRTMIGQYFGSESQAIKALALASGRVITPQSETMFFNYLKGRGLPRDKWFLKDEPEALRRDIGEQASMDVLHGMGIRDVTEYKAALDQGTKDLNESGATDIADTFRKMMAKAWPDFQAQVDSERRANNQITESLGYDALSLKKHADAANAAAEKLDPDHKDSTKSSRQKTAYPSKAGGGEVLSSGAVIVHAGEMIMPARVTREFKVQGSRAFSPRLSPVNISYAPIVNINGAAGDARNYFASMLLEHKAALIRLLDDRYRDRAMAI